MSLASYMQTAASAGVQSPQTPEAGTQQAVVQTRTDVTYVNAGQEPQTVGNYSILPAVKGGFVVWLVIIVLLWLAFLCFDHIPGRSVEITATVKES